MKKWYVVISLFILITSTNGCIVIDSGPVPAPIPEPAPAPTSSPDVKLSVISKQITRDEAGIPRLQAKIKNVGTSTVGLVEATVEFFDNNGNLIDSSVDTTTNLEPHQTWDCVITCSGEGCKNVTKSEIHVTGTTTERRRIDIGWK